MSQNRFLIDTHAFLWAISCSERLSPLAREILSSRKNEIYFSKVSYWEICSKVSTGKLALAEGWEEVLEAERLKNRYHWLEIKKDHCEGIVDLEWRHRDPFDRMLISQAKCEGLALVSCDQKFQSYEVSVCW